MDAMKEFAAHPVSHWESCYLLRGQKYRIGKSFTDADGNRLTVGDEFSFVGCKFSKFDDEYILCVRSASGSIQLLRLGCDVDQQDEIVKHFDQYLTRI